MQLKRGDGETSRQMAAAPKGAVFVWCNNHIDYPKNLAVKLGREDLRIVGPVWLDTEAWRGLELPGLVIDHASFLSDKQSRAAGQITAWQIQSP